MNPKQPIDLGSLFRCDSGQQKILLHRESHHGPQSLDQFLKSGANPLAAEVLDAPAEHPNTVEPPAIALWMPAQVVVGTMPEEWARRLKSVSEANLQLTTEPLTPHASITYFNRASRRFSRLPKSR